MPEDLAPGVYVEEVSFRARSIEGVSTSTAGFVGSSPSGPRGVPIHVASVAEFERTFGPVVAGWDLGFAVRSFFANGGVDAWVVGVAQEEPATAGIPALDSVPALALLNLPGSSAPSVLEAALRYADRRRAFLIVDPPGPDPDAAVSLVRALASRGSPNGAVYFPRAVVAGEGGTERACPAGGAVAGVYARTDAARGVWKAPAGVEAALQGIDGVEVSLSDPDSEALNAEGVNTLREFPGSGPVVWGDRTVQGADELASEWKYVPVRRLGLYIEGSLERDTRWAVFEPSDEPLWASLRLAVEDFTSSLYEAGAFAGRTPQEAFFVRCDRTTMTQDDLDAGVVTIVVGFAPLRPAEFVVLQIRQQAASAAAGETGPENREPGRGVALLRRPVSPEGFRLEVAGPAGWTTWTMAEGFEACGPDDPAFVLDAAAGTIRFGDGDHGAVPPTGARIRAIYRRGA